MIHFILNDQVIKTSTKIGVTLLDFIRENQKLKGTKIGCREGDCGACTVLVGILKGDSVNYQSITSCISPLGNVHGKHIVTIEGINLPNKLNRVQKAMADNYATQCGFCTPGFVVSMTGFALKSSNYTQENSQSCNDAISGNICRCTGYKSIEKAGWEIEEKLSEVDDHSLTWLFKEGFIPDYFKDIPQRLKILERNSDIEYPSKGRMVANGTDLYVHNADELAEEEIHLVANVPDLHGILFSEGNCNLGVNTTVTDLLEKRKLHTLFPRLTQFLKLISSEPIRNMGTLGGNFVNASPIGDMSIFFLALNSTLTIKNKGGSERKIPFHSFHQKYKEYDLEEDEILKGISFPVPQENEYFNFEKVSKRTHLDIASVNAAGKIKVENNVIIEAHFSAGGVSAIPKYLFKTNGFLEGKEVNSETVSEASKILKSEISPISDVRGSAEYKNLLARQLFFAHFIEWFPKQIDLNKLNVS